MYYMDSIDAGAAVVRYDVGPFWKYLSGGVQSTKIPPPNHDPDPPPQALLRVFTCPSETDFHAVVWGGVKMQNSLDRNFSYSWNGQLTPDSQNGVLYGGDLKCVSRINMIKQGAHKIVLVEEEHPNDAWSYVGFPNNDADDTPSSRHVGRRANYGFADGHVESLTTSDIGYTTVIAHNDTISPTITNHQTAAYYFHLQSERQ
jgi:prepilin-type processing-associated H-X9-DG protein